jgi:uncharacterized membrane protein YphA (DoxX/SURF4 family)
MRQPAPANTVDPRSGAPADRPAEPRSARWAAITPWISLVVRLALGGVFVAASLSKIGKVDATVRAVRAYRILPESLVHPVAYALPYLELAVGVLLILGLGTRIVAIIAGVMLLLFIAAVASAGARGLKIDCGCFGGGGPVEQTHYLRELTRDSAFFLLPLWLAIKPTSRLSFDGALDL